MSVLALILWPAPADAQSLGEILGDTTRYIGRQLDELSRELDELTGTPPPRRSRIGRPSRTLAPPVGARRPPPLPQRTPRRFLSGEQKNLDRGEAVAARREIEAEGEQEAISGPTSIPEQMPKELAAAAPDEEAKRPDANRETAPLAPEPQIEQIPDAEPAWLNEPPAKAPPRARLPMRKPGRPRPAKKVAEPKPVHPKDVTVAKWTQAEIAVAKRRCRKLLSGLTLVYEQLDPIREGRCGAPAPIMLARVGAPESVRISPPATVTCDLAAKLSRWVEKAVQPAALIHLGSPIVKMRNVASYTCRSRYDDRKKPLSEHGKANALDLAEFETAGGNRIALTGDWPEPIRSEIEPDRAPLGKTVPKPSGGGSPAPAADPVRTAVASQAKSDTLDAGTPRLGSAKTPEENANTGVTGLTAPPPEKTLETASEKKAKPSKEIFLREVHGKACGLFGTVLGPEADASHRDHFHLDMAERKSSSICE